MCTVTVVPWRGLVRLAVNRDELRSRSAALPPEVRRFGSRQAILPVDPAGGGTWVAVNDAAVAMTVLNVTAEPGDGKTTVPELSRGTIIPALLSCDTLSEAVERALGLDARDYASFRLVMIDRAEVAELHSDGKQVGSVRRSALTAPHLFTSSGLGDGLVQGPRGSLFADLFGRSEDWVAAQDAYHRHCWPDRPHLSVCMRRPDARTVSHTVITLGPDRISLAYHPDAPDRPAGLFAQDFTLRQGGER
jgi:hypothetical protein